MGQIATFNKKASHFQKICSQISHRCKGGEGPKIGVRDRLLGVVRMGGGKDNCVSW